MQNTCYLNRLGQDVHTVIKMPKTAHPAIILILLRV